MSPADQLTVARALSVPVVIVLFAWPFHGHAYWATGVFCLAMTTDFFDGRLARRHGRSSPLGSLLDPIADKVLVLGAMIMLVGEGVVPAWMIAAIVVREVLITGLRQAAIRAGHRDRRTRPRQAQDLGAGDRRGPRRLRSRRSLEQRHRLVVDARRGGADRGPRGSTTPAARHSSSAPGRSERAAYAAAGPCDSHHLLNSAQALR